MLSEAQEKVLEQSLSKEELEEAIHKLKIKKIPSKAGLQTFKDILIQPLLDLWIDATKYQALPIFLN